MDIGRQIMQELAHGSEYCDVLGRRSDELREVEEQLEKGKMPGVFRLHSKASELNPRSPEEYLVLLSLVDVRKSKHAVLHEIVETAMKYPQSYHAVKEKVAQALREVCKENIARQKKLDPSLFRGMLAVLSRNTKCFSSGVIVPWLEEGMSGTAALVISRVIMKGVSSREYMEEFVEELLRQRHGTPVHVLIMSVLIKKLKLGQSTVEKIEEYIVEGEQAGERVLAWNKLVLAFVRGYKGAVDMGRVREIYAGSTKEIEKEIQRELGMAGEEA